MLYIILYIYHIKQHMPAWQWYTDEELLALTQNEFPEFQWFDQQQVGEFEPTWDLQDAWLDPSLASGEAQELPPLIQAVAAIDPQTVLWTPIDVKLEAIKMIIG